MKKKIIFLFFLIYNLNLNSKIIITSLTTVLNNITTPVPKTQFSQPLPILADSCQSCIDGSIGQGIEQLKINGIVTDFPLEPGTVKVVLQGGTQFAKTTTSTAIERHWSVTFPVLIGAPGIPGAYGTFLTITAQTLNSLGVPVEIATPVFFVIVFNPDLLKNPATNCPSLCSIGSS